MTPRHSQASSPPTSMCVPVLSSAALVLVVSKLVPRNPDAVQTLRVAPLKVGAADAWDAADRLGAWARAGADTAAASAAAITTCADRLCILLLYGDGGGRLLAGDALVLQQRDDGAAVLGLAAPGAVVADLIGDT